MPTRAESSGCPSFGSHSGIVTLAHGEGGRLTRKLIRELILDVLGDVAERSWADAARLPRTGTQLAMTTDSYVVSPLFFPGGDIGTLAVNGTVNDLAVAGATPQYVSLSLILEEGFGLDDLKRVLGSAATAAREAEVRIVTGDTKVVTRGAADGLFINTAGVGALHDNLPAGAMSLEAGDEILVTGPIGCHGMAIMVTRNDLRLDPTPRSDCASLAAATVGLLSCGARVRAMRDATRGGVAAVLHEWADESGLTLAIDGPSVPVTPEVRGACELLGLDAIHVANEGTMVVAVGAGDSDMTMRALREFAPTQHTVRIGDVRPRDIVPVVITRDAGVETALDEPLGAPLPRIC